ncbi:MAG: ACT domain-containing protein [Euryarchaeota archaeon]|nr:ACT domain-containing protein [Euryarchaeota archaeon]
MKEFKIFVNNKPGELARVTEALATHAVNIKAIASEGGTNKSFLRIVTSDVSTTERSLKNAGLPYELNEILDVELIDRPGELAKIARRLARLGINVESIYILGTKDGKTQIAMVVSDPERARDAIGG